MKRRIAGIPLLDPLARRKVKAFRGWRNSRRIRNALHRSPRRIVIGASATFEPGWTPTGIEALNILRDTEKNRVHRNIP